MAQTAGIPWRGDIYKALMGGAAARGLTLAAEELRNDALPLTPVDRGTLRESAQVEPATQADLEAGVSYDTPYAVRQHEELDYHHTEGQAKYLESPLVDNSEKYAQVIAAQIGDIDG